MNRLLAIVLAATVAASLATAQARATRDGAVIQNSGSTNFSGYTIKIWSDGTTWSVPTRRGGVALGAPAAGKIPVAVATKFFADLKSAKRSGRAVAQSCAKSASFGSTLVVVYHGWTTPDLSCPGNGSASTIAAGANAIASLLKVQGHAYRRIPMLPNEHRRPPIEGRPAPQASASPEPSPSAS